MGKPVYEQMRTVKIKDITAIDEVIRQAEKNGITYTTITISYDHNGKHIKQVVSLRAKPSNLIATANVWMFYCPIVNQTAYKLYVSDDGYLYHRLRFSNVLYRSQTYSKQMREMYTPLWERNKNKYSNEMEQPYFKEFYMGKPTKRYKYLQRKNIVAQQKNIEALKKLSKYSIK